MVETFDNKSEKSKIHLFFEKNKFKIIIFISIIVISTIIFVIFNINNERKNERIAEQYIKAGLLLNSNQTEDSKDILVKIILSKNKFYSNLALSTLIEKNLEKDESKILSYFDIVESLDKSKNKKDLISFKKALFLLKNKRFNEGNKILKKLIDSNSSIKFLAEELINN